MPTLRRATLNHSVALDRVVRVCALAVLLVGLVVLAGWALKIEALKSVLPDLASMKPNAALGFVLAGLALAQRQRNGLRLACAAAMLVLGGLSLAQDIAGADFGTDQLLFRDASGAAQTVTPGRMSPIAAVDLILLGGALALLGTRQTALRRTLEVLALLSLALALPALIGYAYGIKSFYTLPGFGGMAVHTALAFVLLAIGVLCTRADGLAGVFASAGLGGHVARRFLPLALIAPVLLGWLVHFGESAGIFNASQGTAVFAAAMMMALVALTARIARSLEASDAERQQVENTLRESEAFSRSVIQSSPDCIKVLDLEANLLSMQSGQQLLGIEDIRPFLNKSWLDFWTAGDRQAAQAAVEAALAGGTGAFVGFFRTRQGEGKWWDVAISPILGAHSKPARLLAVSRDVTQRQQAEAVLRQRTAQFETLVDEAPLGIYLIDADFRVRQVNPTARPAFGNIPDLIGREFSEVMHILWPQVQADVVVERFRHTLQTGAACFVPEMIEQRADRQTTEYYEWQINRIPLPDGSHGVVCYFRDISERVLGQLEIRESEARYRSLFNSIDEGFCIIEMIFDAHDKAVDYRFLEVNPAFEPQTGIHDATGKRMRQIAPAHDEHWFEMFGRVALTGEAVRFVSDASALGGRWFDVYAFRLGGPPSHKVALLFSDITGRKHSEEALRESNKELTAFNRVAVGRELRMIELKQEINGLCVLAGQPPRYAPAIEAQQL